EPYSTEPDQAAAEAFAREVEKATIGSYAGASIRGGTSHVDIRLVAGLKMVRASFDVERLNSDDRPLIEHQISYIAWAEDGLYSVTFQSEGEHAAAVDALADSSALTLRVSRPAQIPAV